MGLTLVPTWSVDIAPVDDTATANSYLTTLWQVLAAAVGVSIALIAFVLEAFVNSAERKHGGTLKEFASDTGLLMTIDLAAASLVTVGIVLQGNVHDAPAGWAGAAAIVFSGASLVALLVVIPRRILKALDSEELRRVRHRRIMATIHTALREQIVGQLGDHLVGARSNSRVARDYSAPKDDVVASRDGYVTDIRLAVIERSIRAVSGKGHVGVLVAIGDDVRKGQALAGVPAECRRWTRWRLRRAFVLRRASDAFSAKTMNRTLDRLGQQGLEAIRSRQETEWREINELYRQILVGFPTAAAALGLTFDGAISQPGILGYGPTRRLLDDLRDGIQEVLRADDRGIADALAHTFVFVADEVAELDAPATLRDCLGMYVAIYVFTREAIERGGPTPTTDLLLERSHRLLFDGLDRVGGYTLGDPASSLADQTRAVANLRSGFAAVQQLLRIVVTRRDAEVLDRGLMRLDELSEPWEPSYDDDAPVRELLRDIDGMLLVIAMWTASLLAKEAEPSTAAHAQSLRLLLARLTDVGEVLAAYDHVAADRDKSFGDDWSFWFYDDKRGSVHSLDADPEIDRALVLTLIAAAGRGQQVSIQPRPLLDFRADGIVQALDLVAADSTRWAFLVGPLGDDEAGATPVVEQADPFQVAVSTVRRAVGDAMSARAEQLAEDVRRAGLAPDQVQAFIKTAVRSAKSGRVLRDLIDHLGGVRTVDVPDQIPLVFRTWMNKRFLTGDSSYVGQDMSAKELGRRARVTEIGELLKALPMADSPVAEAPEIRGAVTAAIEEMRRDGQSPSLMLIPIGYELPQALGVHPFGRIAIDSDKIPVAHATAFNGVIDDVPVIDDPRVPADRVVLIDLLGAVRFEEWPSMSKSGIELEVRAFDADQADGFVREHPSVVAPDSTESDTILLLQERVLIEMKLCWRIVLSDPQRFRLFGVPIELQRNAS